MSHNKNKDYDLSKDAKENSTSIAGCLFHCVVMFIFCNLFSLVLNWLVFPIVYLIFHDCGSFICPHTFEQSWFSYIITLVASLVVFPIVFLSQNSTSVDANNTKTTRRTSAYAKRTTHRAEDLETDYYDEDMEGAPGYYGDDE